MSNDYIKTASFPNPQRERERERETETETETERQRQRDRDRDRQTERDRERETERDRDRERRRAGQSSDWLRATHQLMTDNKNQQARELTAARVIHSLLRINLNEIKPNSSTRSEPTQRG